MDDKEYLKHISSTVRPQKAPNTGFTSSPLFKVILFGVIGLILIIVLGSFLGDGDGKTKLASLQLHLDNTSELISVYQKSIKSSDLRSTSASLYSVLTNTSREVEDFLKTNYEFSVGSLEQNVKDQATINKDELDAELLEAKINGLLDRVFVLKIKYEISAFMAEETDIYNSTSNESLQTIIGSSYSSLSTLYDKLDSFSETK